MKVLIVRNADTSNFGGAESFVVSLAVELAKNNVDVVVGTAIPRLVTALEDKKINHISSPWISQQNWHGAKTALIPLLHLPWIIRLTIWYLSAIKNQQPDIIHPMNRDDFIAATIAGSITRKPVIWTDHADLKHEFINTAKPLKNFMGRILLHWSKHAAAITVVSKTERKMILENAPSLASKEIKVIYNGSDLPSNIKPAKKPKNTIVIGITARILNQKGLRELVDSFKQLKTPSGKKLELWMIGDGPDRKALEKRADDNRIKFMGYQTNYANYVSAFDIFAFPTYTEGFSVSLVEAAMLGRPIITTDVGGNPEIIKHQKTGLLIPAKDTDELTASLQELIDYPEAAKKLGDAAHRSWVKDFTFSKIVKNEFIPLYKILTANK